MESHTSPPPAGRCACACPCCCSPSVWCRSVKRKLDVAAPPAGASSDVARVEVENEVAALREALVGHQQSIQELCEEVEEERNAASTAASEAMSMILRLQREKAEALMEARQFKRFAEEKMAHDQRELAALDDLLFKRDQALQSLSCQLQAYRHRLLSYGIYDPAYADPQTPDASADGDRFDLPQAYDYPPLRCTTAPADLDPNDNDYTADLEKYAFGETPQAREDFHSLEHRIRQLETTPCSSGHVMEKGVLAGQSLRQPTHLRSLSADSYGSEPAQELKKGDEFPLTVDRPSDDSGGDDTSDRVYTIDEVHGVPVVAACGNCTSTPMETGDRNAGGGEGKGEEGGDIKKLYVRLQSLEADRESMRQAIIGMRTEKAQLVLLREIAQQLCKEVKPERRVVKKPSPSVIGSFSIVSVIKWIVSILFWRRKASPSKYTFGLSNNNAGLLLLLDKSPRMSPWRCLRRTRG